MDPLHPGYFWVWEFEESAVSVPVSWWGGDLEGWIIGSLRRESFVGSVKLWGLADSARVVIWWQRGGWQGDP